MQRTCTRNACTRKGLTRRSRSALATLALSCATGVAPAAVLFVDDDAPPGGDGSSWSSAIRDLQDALALAAEPDVDEIRVAQGFYRPDLGEQQDPGDRHASFVMLNGVRINGGYAGPGAADPDARDIDAYETILGGDLRGDDGPAFANYDDNSLHVVDASGTDDTAVIDGFTIRGGYADDLELGSVDGLGGGLLVEDGRPWVRRCTFDRNAALGLGGHPGGGGLYGFGGSVEIEHCHFRGNMAGTDGGGVLLVNMPYAEIRDCTFSDNIAAVGAGFHAQSCGDIVLSDCAFDRNESEPGGGGAIFFDCEDLEFTRCVFRNNTGSVEQLSVAGALLFDCESALLVDCIFAGNFCGDRGGAVAAAARDTLFVNCVFSRNIGSIGGGIFDANAGPLTLINCTFSRNEGNGIESDSNGDVTIYNSIFWENTPDQLVGLSNPTVGYSDVQGGFSGAFNIDADPLFVQPGLDDLRLGIGSPCVDRGLNDVIPEFVEDDVIGNPRIIGGIVDMGAYEGEYETLPPADGEENLDQGDLVILIPRAGELDLEEYAIVFFQNVSGPENASVVVTETEADLHAGAGGFTELSSILSVETSLADGEFLAFVFIPFEEDDFGGVDPLTLDLTYFDAGVGNWALGVSRNTADSPGHPRPIGDRFAVTAPDQGGTTTELGDYGVLWNPETRRGYVWGDVDHAADFALGFPRCPADAAQPPDGMIDTRDIIEVLKAWSAGAGPFDVNNDDVVDFEDIQAVLVAWGMCE